MKTTGSRVKIGIVGCGAIGSRMAEAICKDFKADCRLVGLYDIEFSKVKKIVKKFRLKRVFKRSLLDLIKKSDCVVEATNAKDIHEIIYRSIQHRKSIVVMSVGKLLNAPDLFQLARKNKCYILLPSGAIAGVDAIKAASLKTVHTITLTTRKPPIGFGDNPYLRRKGIDPSKISKETLIFKGDVPTALKHFPQNINVAATVALACQNKEAKKKITIQIITSPQFKTNSHEIEVIGEFGHMLARTDNVVCPDNPKSSYLAVLSGLQTLKQYCTGILIGT